MTPDQTWASSGNPCTKTITGVVVEPDFRTDSETPSSVTTEVIADGAGNVGSPRGAGSRGVDPTGSSDGMRPS